MNTRARGCGHAVRGAVWCAALACALGAAAGDAATVRPAPAAPVAGASPVVNPAPAHGTVTQSVRGEHVRIEGKLYSPQALFLVSRRTETFGLDAIVPNYLTVQPDAAFLPYRLQTGTPPAAAVAPGSAPDAGRRKTETQH